MFESSNRITLLCKSDFAKLTKLKSQIKCKSTRYGKGHPKLDTAVVVDDQAFPPNMARIGTRVSLKDLGTGSIAKFILSEKAGKQQNNESGVREVAITSSLGIALLGTRMGEHIKWTLPNGHTRYLRISELAAQTAIC